jgi:hypothetical protein
MFPIREQEFVIRARIYMLCKEWTVYDAAALSDV